MNHNILFDSKKLEIFKCNSLMQKVIQTIGGDKVVQLTGK